MPKRSPPQEVADTSRSREVVPGLSAESREQVDELAGKAVAAGEEAADDGGMYMRGFADLDGHQWSFAYMDFEVEMLESSRGARRHARA